MHYIIYIPTLLLPRQQVTMSIKNCPTSQFSNDRMVCFLLHNNKIIIFIKLTV